jgi:hypothetical protein
MTNVVGSHLEYQGWSGGVWKSKDFTINSLKEMWDVVTPNYRELLASGAKVIPVNPVTIKKRELLERGSGTLVSYNDPTRYGKSCMTDPGYQISRIVGDIGLGLLYTLVSPTFFSASAVQVDLSGLASANQLVPSALAKARLKDMDVLTTLLELRKTIELVTKCHTRVLARADKITTKLRKKGMLDAVTPRSATNAASLWAAKQRVNLQLFNRFLDAFYETWMENRYGWRILLYDLENLQDTYLKWRLGVGPVVKGFAESSTVFSVVDSSGTRQGINFPGLGLPTAFYEYQKVLSKRASRRVGLGYQFAFANLMTIDPIVSAYEVIPFSFIADWFTNLGDIARAYSPFGAGNVLWLWTSVLNESVATVTMTTKETVVGSNTQFSCPLGDTHTGTSSVQVYTRTPLDWNSHKPEVLLKNELDIPKVLDILSVLRTLGGPLKPWLRV